MQNLLTEIKGCTLCEEQLPHGPKPVVWGSPSSKILIIGQAPGSRVHATGIPWNDPSGKELRRWLDVDDATFYDTSQFALMPMGFCYPGTGKSGDLPPRPECAPTWHQKLWDEMPDVKLTLLIGKYAQDYYLKKESRKNLTENVTHWKEFLPAFLPTPHPSPRNRRWQARNPWFETDVVPALRNQVHALLTE